MQLLLIFGPPEEYSVFFPSSSDLLWILIVLAKKGMLIVCPDNGEGSIWSWFHIWRLLHVGLFGLSFQSVTVAYCAVCDWVDPLSVGGPLITGKASIICVNANVNANTNVKATFGLV